MIRRFSRILPPLVVMVVVLAAWEGFVVAFSIERFLLPAPSLIAQTFWSEFETVWAAGFFTLRAAMGGLVAGVAMGAMAALAAARWTVLREAALPFAIAANSAPIIALAPITNQWFGATNQVSKMAVVAVMVFFPVMINLVRGLTSADTGQLELMRALAAPEREALFKVRLPTALPYLFNALRVAAVLSLIGAIVAEYFGGSGRALGVYISQQASLPRMANAWAGIIVATALGAGLTLIIGVIERLVMPWHVSVRRRSV